MVSDEQLTNCEKRNEADLVTALKIKTLQLLTNNHTIFVKKSTSRQILKSVLNVLHVFLFENSDSDINKMEGHCQV